MAELKAVLGDDGELAVIGEANPMPDLELGAFFETLCGILREADPAGTPIPHLMTGSNDARNFASLGIRTYGFLPHNFVEGCPMSGRCTTLMSGCR